MAGKSLIWQYAFKRNYNGHSVLVTVNNSDTDFMMALPAQNTEEYVGRLSDVKVPVIDGYICLCESKFGGNLATYMSGG